MRKWLIVACLLLLPAPSAWAQAPNRSSEVAAIVSQHPETFAGDPAYVDERKLSLLRNFIVPGLNRIDGGMWGLLLKTDQNGRIPADIVVWRPTMEHFDVLTDSGPMWGPNGPVTNPRWIWLAAEGNAPAPSPNPSPAPNPNTGADMSSILQRFDTLREHVDNNDQSLRDAMERMFAQWQLADADQRKREAEILDHVDNPGWFQKVFSNRYVQVALGGLATWLGTQAAK